MNFEAYRELFRQGAKDEAYFILGIDIGDSSSSVAYFDMNGGKPEIIDISGGYGKPNMPTALQYVPETNEWVFGDYAILGMDNCENPVFTELVDKLGKGGYIEAGGGPRKVSEILGLYLRELCAGVKSLNPRAEICGIVVAVPCYMSEDALTELRQAFNCAGLLDKVISFKDDRECLLCSMSRAKTKPAPETAVVVDFGSRALRAGVYEITGSGGEVSALCKAFLFDEEAGSSRVEEDVLAFFLALYKNKVKGEKIDAARIAQLKVFTYNHKDLLFQGKATERGLKLYFNFAYPPFQETIHKEQTDALTRGAASKASALFERLLETAGLDRASVSRVICTGGGFEMLWARELTRDFFADAEISFHKNAKGLIAEGASVLAAAALEAIPRVSITISDDSKLEYDIGLKIIKNNREIFFPLAERGTFWWQKRPRHSFILTEETIEASEIELFIRDKNGDTSRRKALPLSGLPPRPAGTTRLAFDLGFTDAKTLVAKVTDMGFGSLFPKSGFGERFEVKI